MTGRDWKPGDVAVNEAHGYRGIFVDHCTEHDTAASTSHWHNESGRWDDPNDYRRPLVVIDPEDREQVERLSKAMHESDHIAPWHDLHSETRDQIECALQAALRSLITPPKPEEPTARWSRVEDDKGQEWIRVATHDKGCNDWCRVTTDAVDGSRYDWSQISAVKVLSEGVS